MKITTDAHARTGRIDIPDVMGARIKIERADRWGQVGQAVHCWISKIRAEIASNWLHESDGEVWFEVSNASSVVSEICLPRAHVQGVEPEELIREIVDELLKFSSGCKRPKCSNLFIGGRADKLYCSVRCRRTEEKARNRQRLNAAAAT